MSNKCKEMPHEDNLCLSDLAGMVQGMLSKLSVEINQLVESSITRLKADLASLHAHYKTKLEIVEKQIDHVTTTLQSTLDSNARVAHQKKLLVYGIPEVPNESLGEYFSSVCAHLGYPFDQHPIAHLTRLTGSNKHENRGVKPIMIEFAMLGQRREFFSKYLNTCSLSLIHLGFETNNRIFINECLSSTTREALLTAIRMKKDGKLLNVYTRNGIVHAVTISNKIAIINTAEDLLEKLDEPGCE